MIFVVSASRPIPLPCMDVFYFAAREIYGSSDRDRVDLNTPEFEGSVSYTGKSGCMGSVSGPLFEGILELSDVPTIRVTFVCRRSSLGESQRLGFRTVAVSVPLPRPVRFAEFVPDTSGAVQ